MFFAGLWERQSPLYCRPRYNPRMLIIWEEDTAAWEEGAATGEDTAAWGWHRIFLAVGGLVTHLDVSIIAMISRFGITNLATSVIAISIAMIDSSAIIITIVSSSPLILPPLASLGGTPTTTGTPIMAMILIMATEQLTTP